MAKQLTFSYKISENTQQEMIEYFRFKKREKTPPYAVFQANEADTVVTLYESGKVVFQGISADIDANMWRERERSLTGRYPINNIKEKKKPIIEDKIDYYFINSFGSDEVGTGDYFGPIVVTASYVNRKDIPFLESLKVRDSKMIPDEKIRKIAPLLIENIPHTTIILTNEKYNEIYNKNTNMNTIKAILHNKVLYNLLKNNNYKYDMVVIDQFVNKEKFYEYLSDTKEIVQNITFTTKAEDKCLSVACSSIISRYIFLQKIDELSKELKIKIPLGAGIDVDKVGEQIVNKYSKNKLRSVAKLNFRNTKKILENEHLKN